jgi:hypothetical protein
MKKFLTTVALLTVTVMATPTFAQSFDPDNGSGNVLTFSHKSSAPQDDKTVVRHRATIFLIRIARMATPITGSACGGRAACKFHARASWL